MAENQNPQTSRRPVDPLFAPPTKDELSLAKNELFAPPSDEEMQMSEIVSTGQVSGELGPIDRMRLGFASGNEERRGLIQKLYPGVEFARVVPAGKSVRDADEVIKLPGQDGYTYIDSPSFTLTDAADFVGDIPATATGIASALMALPTGPGAIAAGAAGAGAGEVTRKMIGRGLLGVPYRQSIGQDALDVGLSTAVGGAIPAAGQAVGKVVKNIADEGVSALAKPLKNQVGAIRIGPGGGEPGKLIAGEAGEAVLETPAAKAMLRGDGAKEAEAVKEAAGLLGIKPTRGMLSKDPIAKGLESSLSQSPTVFGTLVRVRTEKVVKGLEKVVDDMTSFRTKETAEQIGDGLKQRLTEKITERYSPIQATYNSIRESTKNIPVNERSMKSVARNIRQYAADDLIPGEAETTFVNNIANKLETIKSADQIKGVKTVVLERLRNGPPEQRYALAPLLEKLERLERNTIMRQAIKVARTSKEGEDIGRGLINELKGANKDFRELITLLQEVGGKTKISKARTVTQFLDDLDDVNSIELADKLFKAKNTRLLNTLKTEFPDEFDLVRKHQIKKIYEASLDGDNINAKKFVDAVDAFEPEVQRLLFGENITARNISPDQAIQSLRTLVNSWPKKMGPSGTPQGLDYQDILNPAMTTRDAGRYMLYMGKSKAPKSEGLIRKETAVRRGLLTPTASDAAIGQADKIKGPNDKK